MPSVRFIRAVPDAITPMPADKAALGAMPITAFRYGEAMRAASATGWYLFPPEDIELMRNGADIFRAVNGQWQVLDDVHEPEFQDHWNQHCPPRFQGLAPPFVQVLPAKDALQVWSGWLIETSAGFSSLVRPIVNAQRSQLYHCYEGVIETDRLAPCPLFINLQLVATHMSIQLQRTDPLFQLQLVARDALDLLSTAIDEAFPSQTGAPGMTDIDWQRFRATVRTDGAHEAHRLGDDGVDVRRRQKSCTRDQARLGWATVARHARGQRPSDPSNRQPGRCRQRRAALPVERAVQ